MCFCSINSKENLCDIGQDMNGHAQTLDAALMVCDD
jgi:hypothetical protein